jgi:hypothetical protein
VVSNSIRLPRQNGWHRIAVLVLGVAAIVVGLLAMHVISGGDRTSHHTAVSTQQHGDTMTMMGTSPVSAAVDCNGTCESGHNMGSMACLLALLITTIILTVRVIITRWGSDLYRLIAALSAAMPATVAPRLPPSLLTLSISRT